MQNEKSKYTLSSALHNLRRLIRHLADRAPIMVTIGAFITGVIIWGGFNTALELTNTESFCISCHEMRSFVYPEYIETTHHSNPSGVRASCPDCHVPADWPHMVVRKVLASNELFHKIAGSIDTRQKFESRRMELAENVWRSMRGSDSRECRNCHAFDAMELASQPQLARDKHSRAAVQGMTCIDCHLGLAHEIPKNFDADGTLHRRFKETGRPCSDCHTGMTRAPD